jgi:hypothetical protein
MATARPFAYNIGAPIAGTEQVGGLAVGTPTSGFASTGLPWWNGPDEEEGYVIAQSVPSDTQPTPVSGVSASVGFFRSSDLTDPSFISISNAVAGPSGGGPFASGSAAKIWLNANGYWTSYSGANSFVVTVSQVGGDVVWSGSGGFDLTGLTYYQNINTGNSGSINANFAVFASSPNPTVSLYYGSSSSIPSTFGSGNVNANFSSGDSFGVIDITSIFCLAVPDGYVSGSYISGTMTFTGQTIAGLGLTEGTYTYTWTSGANQTGMTLIIGSGGATGGGYTLITTPYNPPAAGKTIFPNFGAGGATSGILNPNTFATGAVYWNPIDANNVDQTSYYNGMLTRSVTAAFTQNGNTAIYSGVTGAFTFIPGATGVSGSFAYNPQVNPGKLTLTQASPVNFTLGGTVYISYT